MSSGACGRGYIIDESTIEIEKPRIEDAHAALSQDSLTYDSQAKEPSVTVTYEGKVLQKDKDYSEEYMDNTEAGTTSVIITGIEDYAGSLTMDFLIIRRESDNSITASDRYASYSSKPQNVRLGACAKGGTLTYQSSKVEVTPEGIVKLPGKFTGKRGYSHYREG